ncbi:MAG: DoxX family protein [Bacteroidales bacterium]|nr:DoxX family protein [Bacteroidales bacterium]
MKTILNVCRYLLAFLFIFSGFVKGVDPLGFAYKLTDYFKAFNADFFEPIALLLSFVLCAGELLIGLLLLFGVRLKLAVWGAFLFMVFFTPLTFILAIFNPVHDCGCFGDAIKLTNWQTFYKNIIFFAAALLLFIKRSSLPSNTTILKDLILFVILAIIAFIPPFIGYTRLPMFDYRPFSIGVNIPNAMVVPEGAPSDVYKTTLYYKKNGIVKEFSENNIPWQDSTWKFVDSKSVLIKKGFTPSIESFGLMTISGREITDSILSYPSYYFLAVAYRLDKTNLEATSKLNELYSKAAASGYGFACVTASTQGEIDNFVAKTGALYPFLNADEVLLKTVIRANPGLILLNKGTIIGQWHKNHLPDASYIAGDLNAKQISLMMESSNKRLTLMLLSLLGLSLALIYIIKQKN